MDDAMSTCLQVVSRSQTGGKSLATRDQLEGGLTEGSGGCMTAGDSCDHALHDATAYQEAIAEFRLLVYWLIYTLLSFTAHLSHACSYSAELLV